MPQEVGKEATPCYICLEDLGTNVLEHVQCPSCTCAAHHACLIHHHIHGNGKFKCPIGHDLYPGKHTVGAAPSQAEDGDEYAEATPEFGLCLCLKCAAGIVWLFVRSLFFFLVLALVMRSGWFLSGRLGGGYKETLTTLSHLASIAQPSDRMGAPNGKVDWQLWRLGEAGPVRDKESVRDKDGILTAAHWRALYGGDNCYYSAITGLPYGECNKK